MLIFSTNTWLRERGRSRAALLRFSARGGVGCDEGNGGRGEGEQEERDAVAREGWGGGGGRRGGGGGGGWGKAENGGQWGGGGVWTPPHFWLT